MEHQKARFTLRMDPELMARVDALYKQDGSTTKTEFMERAIMFYCGYLTAKDYKEYFPNIVVSTMKASLDALENRMAKLLFKNAVSISMMMHIMASVYNIDEKSLRALEGLCISEVKRVQGTIHLRDAINYQKG